MLKFGRTAKHVPPPVEALQPVADPSPPGAPRDDGIGTTEAFALACLDPSDGQNLTLQQMWDAYEGWCRTHNSVAIAYPLFHEEMARMAEAIGMGRDRQGGHELFFDVALRA